MNQRRYPWKIKRLMAKMEMRGQMNEERAAGAAGVLVIRYLGWLWVWHGSHPTRAAVCRPSPGRWWPWGGRRPAANGTAGRHLQPRCAWRLASPPSCTCFHHRREWRPLWERDKMDDEFDLSLTTGSSMSSSWGSLLCNFSMHSRSNKLDSNKWLITRHL